MRKRLIAGNWKLQNNSSQTTELIGKIIALTAGAGGVDTVVAPTFTSLHAARAAIGSSGIGLAAQDIFWEEKGAFTGEIAPAMLVDAGCQWAIIGHSERRQYFGETDETVNKKIKAALKVGLKPIVCVGETLDGRESGKTEQIIEKQLVGGFKDITDFSQIVVAYEPVWAIGTGKNASPAQAQEVHAFIRTWIAKNVGKGAADNTRILYGGSVKASNAAELLACPDIDGALIGGASLIADDFSAIIRLSVEK